MSRLFIVSCAAFAIVAALVSTAEAIEKIDPVDPQNGSPSGFVYAIPLDEARKDAAPVGSGVGTGDRAPIHSDDGFGSSTDVPGVEATPESSDDTNAGKGGSGSGGAGGGADSEGQGSGAAPGGGGSDGGSGPPVVTEASVSGPDSAVVPLGVMGLALLAGAGLAFTGLRARSS